MTAVKGERVKEGVWGSGSTWGKMGLTGDRWLTIKRGEIWRRDKEDLYPGPTSTPPSKNRRCLLDRTSVHMPLPGLISRIYPVNLQLSAGVVEHFGSDRRVAMNALAHAATLGSKPTVQISGKRFVTGGLACYTFDRLQRCATKIVPSSGNRFSSWPRVSWYGVIGLTSC